MNIKFKIISFIIVVIVIAVLVCGLTHEHKYNGVFVEAADSNNDKNTVDTNHCNLQTYEKNHNEQISIDDSEIVAEEESSEHINTYDDVEDVAEEDFETEIVEEIVEGSNIEVDEEVEEIEEVEEVEESIISLGEFTLTAYCSCEICCGEYALNRPIDENGNEIVYGASGTRLVAGVSIAVDPYVIPYGSEVMINGNTYVAQDTGGAINGNRIDVYFDNHEEAWNFGLQYAEVFLIK